MVMNYIIDAERVVSPWRVKVKQKAKDRNNE